MTASQPAGFEQQYLSANDFDGTIALTSEPAPSGITIALAYESAVRQVLGDEALVKYKELGGLRNRAPAEVVMELAPDLGSVDIRQRTEDLVESKMLTLSSQVGRRLPDGNLWPRQTKGFADFWAQIANHPHIDTAIVSSGHQYFIERFYDIHELPPPNVMVTDDDMRPLMEHLPPELCVKPGRLLIDTVHARWLQYKHMEATHENFTTTRERIIYAGDDPVKDGLLAENAGVDFTHIDPSDTATCWIGLSKFFLTPTETVHA